MSPVEEGQVFQCNGLGCFITSLLSLSSSFNCLKPPVLCNMDNWSWPSTRNFLHSKLHAHFQSMEVRNSTFAAFIDVFTPNTYVMVIMSDNTIRKYIYNELSHRWHLCATSSSLELVPDTGIALLFTFQTSLCTAIL